MDSEVTGRKNCKKVANILANQSYGKGGEADLVPSCELKPFLKIFGSSFCVSYYNVSK
jgi:hypothetical protein